LIVVLVLTSIIGLWAAFELTMEKFVQLANPDAVLGCNFSVLVQCGANLQSWQGAVFGGIPNPVWGLIAWAMPIVVAVALIAGATFQRWFWWLLNLGYVGALAFVIWLMSESIFNLNTLCPWCMVTWSVTILAFWTQSFYNLKEGHLGQWGRRFGEAVYTWAPLFALGSYIVVAVIAQLRLDFLSEF
jgi:uncharacterized membrane protein